MSTLSLEPLLHQNLREIRRIRFDSAAFKFSSSFLCLPPGYGRRRLCRFIKPTKALSVVTARASDAAATVETTTVQESTTTDFAFPLKRTDKVEGKILVRLDKGMTEKTRRLTVGCTIAGKWILHWGVSYIGDVGREWDQPPAKMMPPGSVPIKDYAIETPLEKASSSGEGNHLYEINIDIEPDSEVAAVNFVIKDEESGMWYQHRGTDFKVPLDEADANVVGAKRGFGLLPEDLGQIPSIVVKTEVSNSNGEDISSGYSKQEDTGPYKFYEEVPFVKQIHIDNSVSVSVRKCPDTARNIVHLDTDLPGDVIVHWGVCTSSSKVWEIPTAHHPPQTTLFKNKALRTLLQHKDQGNGSSGIFTLDEEASGFLFVLKLEENIWLKHSGNDFYIPLTSHGSSPVSKKPKIEDIEASAEKEQVATTAYSKGIVKEIRNLIGDISSEKVRRTQSKEVQETILQEIERLAAEAYGIFRSSQPTFLEEEAILESEELEPPLKICSGTGTGYEIVCQGFNWESHKSASWYKEVMGKASELGSLGFSVIWLPPPTDSVSPEGYMPRDLYNLNSRYGTYEELKEVVKKFHDLNIKVLGDVVLNHRCAQYKNQNGVWNIFGGRLNWDDRAVVADDPHFQGRGNKSSGDNFHAAPNIDHSQDFVRNDLKEWLLWLRKDIGYDGWRLDFARGFWGGYVKDYMEATEPYFAVGEFWDSLSYTYGEMDHNQDAHRQRIVDWINATNGTASAFDVTTKGILHAALERCEYWRLSDQNGKPPGVIGWWPSRAVTFVENHDTGSTQGHWRFPGGKEMQGYAYILTHPGTPAVFYDHIFSHNQHEIASLISLRNRNKINCRSSMKITKADRDVYAAIIDEKVAVKIGPGSYEPPSGGKQKWSKAAQGRDYIAWEDTSS